MKKQNNKKNQKYPKGHVDLVTGTIYDCVKGSWKWYHEKGHIIYNDVKSWNLMLRDYCFYLWTFFTTLGLFCKYFAWVSFILICCYMAFDVYEEQWCNNYADKHYRGLK